MRAVREQPRLALARVLSAVCLVAIGIAIGAIVRGDDGGVSRQSLRNWVRQERVKRHERDDGLTRDERAELIELRRRVSGSRRRSRSFGEPGPCCSGD